MKVLTKNTDYAIRALPERMSATSAAHPTTDTTAALPDENSDNAVAVDAVHVETPVPTWVYPVGAAVVFLMLAGLVVIGRGSPRRLLPSEREETLAQLRQWIESTELKR